MELSLSTLEEKYCYPFFKKGRKAADFGTAFFKAPLLIFWDWWSKILHCQFHCPKKPNCGRTSFCENMYVYLRVCMCECEYMYMCTYGYTHLHIYIKYICIYIYETRMELSV